MRAEKIGHVARRFPKLRPELPESHLAIYYEEYALNRGAARGMSRVVGALEGWMHRWIARQGGGFPVLEIGAGTLNHLRYERMEGSYDIVEPLHLLYRDRTQELALVREAFADIGAIPADRRYRRIITVAVLEHLEDLPLLLAQTALLLEQGGVLAVGVPSVGAFAWGYAWRCTTALSFRMRRGLSYKVIMDHEHINNVHEIDALLNYFFGEVQRARFPFPCLHGSFYTCFTAAHPDRARAEAFVASREVLP